MYKLYIIKSIRLGRHYIGITENIENRLLRHNGGEVRSTKFYKPWQLVHVEEFLSKKEARKREIFLKKTARARKDLFKSFK